MPIPGTLYTQMIRSFLAALMVFACAFAYSQSNEAPTVKVTLPKNAKPGATVKGTVTITFADGLHGYQNPPTDDYQIPVKVSIDTKGFVLKKAEYPKGTMRVSGGDTKPSGLYEGTIKIPVTIVVPKKAGDSEIKVTVNYQQCNEQSCFPPDHVTSTVKLKIKK